MNCSLSFLYQFTGVAFSVLFCCCSPLLTVHDVVIQRCSSAYFVTSGVFFKSLLPLTGSFLFFRSYSANSRNVFVENPSRSHSKSHQVQVQIPLLWIVQCKHTENHNFISDYSETVTMISEIKSFKIVLHSIRTLPPTAHLDHCIALLTMRYTEIFDWNHVSGNVIVQKYNKIRLHLKVWVLTVYANIQTDGKAAKISMHQFSSLKMVQI